MFRCLSHGCSFDTPEEWLQHMTNENDQRAAPTVRVTVDLTPELYRLLKDWTGEAATELKWTRVPVTEAIRTMIWVTAANRKVAEAVLAELASAAEVRADLAGNRRTAAELEADCGRRHG